MSREHLPGTLDPLRIDLHGTQLIEASAGTGKTHAIATLYLRLVLGIGDDLPRQVREILVVTFTRAATEELRGRVRARLFEALDVLERVRAGEKDWLSADSDTGKSLDRPIRELLAAIDAERRVDESITRLKLELATIDDAAIFTIHGFCQRALQEQAFDSGEAFELELVQNDRRRELQAVQDHWRTRYYGDDVLAEVARSRFGTPEALYQRVKPLLRPGLALRIERVSRDDLAARKAVLVASWQHESAGLIAAINAFKLLSRGPYKPELVSAAASMFDEWCGRDALLLPGTALLFGRIGLDDNITKKAKERGTRFPEHPLVTVVSDYDNASNALVQTLIADATEDARVRLDRTRRDSGVAGFDDLVLRLHSALTTPSGARLAEALARRYPVALIDEFQDTDPLQYGIFSKIYGGRERDALRLPSGDLRQPLGGESNHGQGLLLIGDPKQAIYSFRGADVFAYMQARTDTSSERRHSIDINWRSVTPLVAGLNRLFERRRAPFLYADNIAYQPVQAAGEADAKRLQVNGEAPVPLEFWLLPAGEKGALAKEKAAAVTLPRVARRIAELLARGQRGGKPLKPRDIAVLVRTNEQGADVQRELRQLGIGSAMAGTASVFQADEARALRNVLAAIAEPANERALRRALVSPLWPHDAAFLAGLGDDLPAYEQLLQDLHDWRATWLGRGFMPMFRRFLNAAGVAAALLSLPDGERRLTNLVQLAELAQQASREHPTPEALIRWLENNIAVPDGNADDQQLRLESDEDLVQVLTLHRAKGLQYPVVFLPFLYDTREIDPEKGFPRFHDEEGKLVVDLAATAASVERADYERLAEDMRLLYVGLTRAIDYCIVPWGRINKTDRSALAFLLHGPDGLATVNELAAKMAGMSHADLRAELAALAVEHDEWFHFVDVEAADREAEGQTEDLAPSGVPAAAALPLASRESRREVWQCWSTTSFSRLVEESSDEVREVGVRREPRVNGAAGADAVGLSPFTLPGGTEVGKLFHDLLEEIDYAPPLAVPLREVVVRQLARYGKPTSWGAVVTAMIDATLDVELEDGFALRSLPRERRRNEVGFWYPISKLRPESLDAQLPGLGAGIDVRRLTFQPVAGYLEGYIDLVFEHDGRWYIVDWKTNWLGTDASFYSREHLAQEIARSRYDLQYTLYTVALHRHLQRSLGPRYDPTKHLGGVYYLFLRGLTPGDPARPGIWHVPPDVALIEALDALFRGRSVHGDQAT